jgi:hypothetical protein
VQARRKRIKPEVRKELKKLLVTCIQDKIKKYNPETESKPFFEAIFSKRAVNLASLIQSFYTSFGTSIYEQMAVLLAEKNANYHAERQYLLMGKIDPDTETAINNMHLEILKTGRPGVKAEQVERIRKSILHATPERDPESIVDVFVKTPSGFEYYFDVTSVKPNIKEFRTLKKKLLRWIALRLSVDKSAKVNTALAIPYNPYYPHPYARWTSVGIYDSNELLVGPDFWNFLAGEHIYDDLLGVFKEVGNELRPVIDKKVGY